MSATISVTSSDQSHFRCFLAFYHWKGKLTLSEKQSYVFYMLGRNSSVLKMVKEEATVHKKFRLFLTFWKSA